jgi:phosphoglucosamine mutase
VDFITEELDPLDDLPVVVDCGNGTGATITPRLLKDLNAQVIGLNTHVDGRFPGRDPEPTVDSLRSLRECVRSSGSKLGIAHDGDADRMVAVDEKGDVVQSDQLIAIFAKMLKAKTVVVPVDCSMCVDHYLGSAKIVRTRVGDVFVSEEMKKRKADFGGEPSGTFVFPKVSYAPEGIYAAAYLCSIVSGSGSLSSLLEDVPCYPIRRKGVSFKGDRESVRKAIEVGVRAISCKRVDRTDGYRMEFDDGWALIRLSGTEPKVRVMVEGSDEGSADAILALAERMVKGAIRKVKR